MRRLMIALVATTVVMTACTTTTEPTATTSGSITIGTVASRPGEPAAFSLVPFEACTEFLDYVKNQALDLVTPWGLDGGVGYPVPFGSRFAIAEDAIELAAPAAVGGFDSEVATSPIAGVDFSGTNVQELGVDEPDIVKTDGRRIVALSQNTLFVVDVTGAMPELMGKLVLGDRSVQDMFLSGDKVLLMGFNWRPHLATRGIAETSLAPDYYGSPTADLVEIDISDPESIEIVRVLEMDGSYVSARMVDDTVRVVVNSGPTGLVWAFPEGGGLRAERVALEANKEIIRNSTIDNWVPYFVMTNGGGAVVAEGNLVDCDRASHPVEFAGLGMLNVVTIDLSNGLDIVDATGVLAAGQTVYASTDSLYVATQRWVDWAVLEDDSAIAAEIDTVRTAIHQFDISSPLQTSYVASGEVRGFLLNQFAMSEHGGNLRVASTTAPNWWSGNGRESESLVTVLAPEDGVLETIGSVGGLGKGEQIFSVRFIGDVGYVVTFRQTDPLYTIDVSNPRDPRVVGELKILGYSAYLHPINDGLLIGIGQDATEQGRTLGTQVSLFDVNDLSDPIRISQLTLGEGNSTVEYDHRAFLHWPDTGLAVLPVQSYGWDEASAKEEVFFGAIGVDVDPDGELTSLGKISHPGGSSDGEFWDWTAQIQRSIVVGDALYTVSFKGVLKSDLSSLANEVWVPFGVS